MSISLSSCSVIPILVTRFTCYADLPVIFFCYPDPLVSSLIFLSPSRSHKTVFFPQLISAHFALSKIMTFFICAF
jgi:hypothetical protein